MPTVSDLNPRFKASDWSLSDRSWQGTPRVPVFPLAPDVAHLHLGRLKWCGPAEF
jgi:hypothetical protein